MGPIGTGWWEEGVGEGVGVEGISGTVLEIVVELVLVLVLLVVLAMVVKVIVLVGLVVLVNPMSVSVGSR